MAEKAEGSVMPVGKKKKTEVSDALDNRCTLSLFVLPIIKWLNVFTCPAEF